MINKPQVLGSGDCEACGEKDAHPLLPDDMDVVVIAVFRLSGGRAEIMVESWVSTVRAGRDIELPYRRVATIIATCSRFLWTWRSIFPGKLDSIFENTSTITTTTCVSTRKVYKITMTPLNSH